MPPRVNTNEKRKKKNILSETLTNDFPLHDVTEADVDGAIFCPVLAKYIIDLKVDFDFPGHGTFTGTVTNFDAEKTLMEQFFMKSL